MTINKSAMVVVCASLLPILSTTGCATKQFVRNRVDPIDSRVTKVETQAGSLDKKIDTVDENAQRASSHAEEVARGADANAKNATDQATKAQGQADEATKQASSAQSTAQRGLTRIAGMETTIDNLDQYQLVTEESLRFKLGSSELTPDVKQEMEQFTQKINSMKHYVLEVQGYTDSTGPAEYNRELATRRAQAVVRYLTVDAKVPLFRVHSLGVGNEAPVESNKTREGRQQNRRVEVRIFAPPETAGEQAKTGPPGN